jgi:ABC-type arginine transport system permease subunit
MISDLIDLPEAPFKTSRARINVLLLCFRGLDEINIIFIFYYPLKKILAVL